MNILFSILFRMHCCMEGLPVLAKQRPVLCSFGEGMEPTNPYPTTIYLFLHNTCFILHLIYTMIKPWAPGLCLACILKTLKLLFAIYMSLVTA